MRCAMTEESRDVEAEALAALLHARYGDRLSEEQGAKLREAVRGLREAIGSLYAFPLTNADEPDVIFRAYRGGE